MYMCRYHSTFPNMMISGTYELWESNRCITDHAHALRELVRGLIFWRECRFQEPVSGTAMAEFYSKGLFTIRHIILGTETDVCGGTIWYGSWNPCLRPLSLGGFTFITTCNNAHFSKKILGGQVTSFHRKDICSHSGGHGCRCM